MCIRDRPYDVDSNYTSDTVVEVKDAYGNVNGRYTFSGWKLKMCIRDSACFVHLQTLSLSYYNVTPVGYLLSRIMSDTNRIAGIIAWNAVDILWAVFYVLGVFVMMFALDPGLAAAVILIVPVMALLPAWFQDRILRWNRRVRKMNSRITSAYNEGIMGARTSKTLVIEEQNSREFEMCIRDRTAGEQRCPSGRRRVCHACEGRLLSG